MVAYHEEVPNRWNQNGLMERVLNQRSKAEVRPPHKVFSNMARRLNALAAILLTNSLAYNEAFLFNPLDIRPRLCGHKVIDARPLRYRSGFVHCSLVIDSAPPSPPVVRGGGGGGDGDGGDDHYLKMLQPGQQTAILEEWIGRTRIYQLADKISKTASSAAATKKHTIALEVLEALRTFSDDQAADLRKQFVISLSDADGNDQALASAVISSKKVSVSHIALRPAELNSEDSSALIRMVHGLTMLANKLGVALDLDRALVGASL